MSKRSVAARDNKSPFRMLAGISSLEDLVDGVQSMGSMLWGAKTVYFCDLNFGNNGHTGTGGWDNAFKSMTKALAVSNADIASNAEGYAARNVILCKGDTFTENLVLLAQKTDVIGVGHHDRYQTGLLGTHVPTGATCSYGTRFFNFHFLGNATSGVDIWTLDTYCAGLEFHGSFFDSESATPATAAIVAANATDLKIVGNKFGGAFSDSVIELSDGDSRGTEIVGNFIEGADQGIHINSSVGDDSGDDQRSILIEGNIIRAATVCINDASDIAMIMNNNCVSAQGQGAAGAGVIIGNEKLSSGNFMSSDNKNNVAWPSFVVTVT